MMIILGILIIFSSAIISGVLIWIITKSEVADKSARIFMDFFFSCLIQLVLWCIYSPMGRYDDVIGFFVIGLTLYTINFCVPKWS